MEFINHFLSFASFAIGFIICFNITTKNRRAFLFILFLVLGLTIGQYSHLMVQDMWGYDKPLFKSHAIDLEEASQYTIQGILCEVFERSNCDSKGWTVEPK